MGIYIDPLEGTKEQFLAKHGTECNENFALAFDYTVPLQRVPVCLVHNPAFTALGVAVTPEEAVRFATGKGGRQVEWYTVPLDSLEEGGVSANTIMAIRHQKGWAKR